jgi:NAD(P)-dependent dehydrogenase (short-subunit alcohol dehydrogenase family)
MSRAVDQLSRRFPERRAFITGAASGLGLEISRRFAEAGWSLGLLDVDPERLAQTRQSLNTADSSVLTFHADVGDETAMMQALARCAQSFGGLDVLINNAGVAVAGSVRDTPSDDWVWALRINLLGCVHGCRAALPHFSAASGGLILNVASAAGFVCGPSMGPYNASKAAVIALTETLQQELHGTRIQMSVAMPGFFKTHLLDHARAPAAEMEAARLLMSHSRYTVQSAAEQILAAAAAGEFYIIVPRPYVRLWRFKRWLPKRFLEAFPAMRARMVKEMRARSGTDASG